MSFFVLPLECRGVSDSQLILCSFSQEDHNLILIWFFNLLGANQQFSASSVRCVCGAPSICQVPFKKGGETPKKFALGVSEQGAASLATHQTSSDETEPQKVRQHNIFEHLSGSFLFSSC